VKRKGKEKEEKRKRWGNCKNSESDEKSENEKVNNGCRKKRKSWKNRMGS
jgi:hypothetical protein